MNNTEVLSYDCGWSTKVTYSGSTIIIDAPYNWTFGHQYYVTFDSGKYHEFFTEILIHFFMKVHQVVQNSVVSIDFMRLNSIDKSIFEGAESAPITDPNFWVFDIWDPGLSSTVPPTTTTQTTV